MYDGSLLSPELKRGIKLALDAMAEVMTHVEASDENERLLTRAETVSFLNQAYSSCSRAFQAIGEEIDFLEAAHERKLKARNPQTET